MSDHEDVDLFGEDPEAEEEAKKLNEAKKAEADKKKQEEEEKKKKKKKEVIAKSIVIFDVKVFEMDENLEALAKDIKAKVVVDGLVWNEDHKIVPIAFGMKKLELTMVIEDEKVSVDHITEKIEEDWEDVVQSTDIVSFNKS